jgi:hypothetical protein
LPFRITKPGVQKIIAEIEATVLAWKGVRSANHRMGAREFLVGHKEIGHIHWNGDLDIVFGEQITQRLLKRKGVLKHTFVPDIAITFKITGDGDVLFAMALLRYSYLLKRKMAG